MILWKTFQRKTAENMKQEEIEQIVGKKFQEIIAEGKADREIIGKQSRDWKIKKVGDKNNRKAEWIKEGAGKMVQVLATLFKRVVEENKIPIRWREAKKR